MTTWHRRRISDDESAGVHIFFITRRSAVSLPIRNQGLDVINLVIPKPGVFFSFQAYADHKVNSFTIFTFYRLGG